MFWKLRERIDNWMHPKGMNNSDTLYDLLYGDVDRLPTTEDIEIACELEIAKRPVQVAVIRIGETIADPEKISMLLKLCSSASDSEEVLPVSDGRNQAILLFFRDTLWEEQARGILEDLRDDFLGRWPEAELCITLGSVEDYTETGEPAWRKSYRKAIGLQDYRYIKPRGKIIAYSDIVARRERYPKGIHFRFDCLKEYLESGNPEQIRDWLAGVFGRLAEEGVKALGFYYHLALEIVVNAVSLFRERGLLAEDHIGSPEALIEEVLKTDSPLSMQKWTESFLEKCGRILAAKARE